jgi:hypothetical protein
MATYNTRDLLPAAQEKLVPSPEKKLDEATIQRIKASPEGKRIDAMVAGIAPVVKQYVEQRLTRLSEMLGEEAGMMEKRLADRINKLENRKELCYRGDWQPNTSYVENSATTHDGSLWIAKEHTSTKPGGGNVAWQLCVKKGQDARDDNRSRKV